MKRLISGLPLLFTATTLLAQSPPPDDTATPEISGKLLAGGFGVICLFQIVMIGIWLWVAIWIMKDSARRQSPNRTLVVVLGWLVWPIGLIVHLATRPKTIPGSPNP
jgi:hypothetical protein